MGKINNALAAALTPCRIDIQLQPTYARGGAIDWEKLRQPYFAKCRYCRSCFHGERCPSCGAPK